MFPILETLDLAVQKAFSHISAPTEIQLESIKKILNVDNKYFDIIIKSPTGSGKSLAFLLPILHLLLNSHNPSLHSTKDHSRSVSNTPCLIISPTRELARQTLQMLQDILNKLTGKDHWIVAGHLTGGEKKKSEKARLRKGVHIVVGTPGRILDHLKTTKSWSDGIRNSARWIVLDEVDRLKDLGFEKVIGEILNNLLMLPSSSSSSSSKERKRPQIIMSSATASDDTTSIDTIKLRNPQIIKANHSNHRATSKGLRQQVIIPPTKLRTVVLSSILEKFKQDKIVVFLLCCDSVDFFHELFTTKLLKNNKEKEKEKRNLYRLHGSMEHQLRIDNINKFTKEKGSAILFCTDVAARGLNLIKVNTIIQFDAPCDSIDYVHRVGRTARQQEIGQSILFLMVSESDYIEKLKQMGMNDIEKVSWKSFLPRSLNSLSYNHRSNNNDSNNNNNNSSSIPSPSSSDNEDEDEDEEDDDESESKVESNKSKNDNNRNNNNRNPEKIEIFQKKSKLHELGKNGFIGMIRGYATHPKNERDIFHPKKLHLGHLAATFGLKEPPTELNSSSSSSGSKSNAASFAKKINNMDDYEQDGGEGRDGNSSKWKKRSFNSTNGDGLSSKTIATRNKKRRKAIEHSVYTEFGSGL